MLAPDKCLKAMEEMPAIPVDLVTFVDIAFDDAVLAHLASYEDEDKVAFAPVAQGRLIVWASVIFHTINVYRRGFVYGQEFMKVSAGGCRTIEIMARGAFEILNITPIVNLLWRRSDGMNEVFCQCPEFILWILYNLYSNETNSTKFKQAVFDRVALRVHNFWEVSEIDTPEPDDGLIWSLIEALNTAGRMAHDFYEGDYDYP